MAKKTTARKTAKKAAGGLATKVKRAPAEARRTVRKAAQKVEKGASRARDLGNAVVTAGEMIKQSADFAEAMAGRAKKRPRK